MKSKTLTVKVNVLDENYGEGPDAAKIKIDVSLAKRIRQLSIAVKKLKVGRISEFDYTAEFFNETCDTNAGETKPTLVENEAIIDVCELNVGDKDFYWSGMIKHTSIHWETSTIPINTIKNIK
jgi:hypothetical protein